LNNVFLRENKHFPRVLGKERPQVKMMSR